MSPSLFTRVFHLAVPIDKLVEWHEHLALNGCVYPSQEAHWWTD